MPSLDVPGFFRPRFFAAATFPERTASKRGGPVFGKHGRFSHRNVCALLIRVFTLRRQCSEPFYFIDASVRIEIGLRGRKTAKSAAGIIRVHL